MQPCAGKGRFPGDSDPGTIWPKKECIKSCETCFVYTLSLNDKGPSLKWVCFSKFYCSLANWPLLRISPHSSLYVIYCLILTAWQWLMSFTCIPVQIEPNESLLRKKLLVLLLWEFGHLSSPSRSCLGRLILICSRWGTLWAKLLHNCVIDTLSHSICISKSNMLRNSSFQLKLT